MTRLLFHCSGNSLPVFVDLPKEPVSAGTPKWGLPISAFSEHHAAVQTHVDGKQLLATVDATKAQIIQSMFVLYMPRVHSGRNWECLTHVLPAIRKSSLYQKQGNFSVPRSDHEFRTGCKTRFSLALFFLTYYMALNQVLAKGYTILHPCMAKVDNSGPEL